MWSEDIFSDCKNTLIVLDVKKCTTADKVTVSTFITNCFRKCRKSIEKNLIEIGMMYIKSNVEREIYEDNLTFTDTFLSQSKSQASGILKNPKIIRKKINEDSYIVHCYKYKNRI